MYWVYVLENSGNKGWYIGATSNLEKRVVEHQHGHGSRTTELKDGWQLIYCKGYINKHDAFGREKFLKSGAGRKLLKKQLSNYLN